MSEKEFAVGDDFNFLGKHYVIDSYDENGITLRTKPKPAATEKKLVKKIMWKAVYKNPSLYDGVRLFETREEALQLLDPHASDISPVGCMAIEVEVLEGE